MRRWLGCGYVVVLINGGEKNMEQEMLAAVVSILFILVSVGMIIDQFKSGDDDGK